MAASMSNSLGLRSLLAALILATVGALGWQHFGPARRMPLTADRFAYSAGSDLVSGGNSSAKIGIASGVAHLVCTIRRGYAWPYCVASIRLGDEPDGMDLTPYETLRLNVAYAGPGQPQLRLHLRDFEHGISSAERWNSLKVNEVWFDVPPDGRVDVPLKVFRVASWWLAENKVPLDRTDARLDNVVMMEFSTPNDIPDGEHRIDLSSIELVGRPFDQQRLTMGLLACWLCFGVASLALELRRYRTRFLAERRNVTKLEALNETLKIEARELSDKVGTDPLTGAFNREGLRDFLLERWRSAGDGGAPLSAIFADIDHFKRINDTLGHGAGDEVLRQFTEVLRRRIRSTDCLVRWGGEEFLIVCPDVNLAQGQVLAETLRASVETFGWPHDLRVTASFGVASREGDEDFGAVLARADARVYEAKRSGRNRVVGG